MEYKPAKELVVKLCYALQPYCEKLNIAGSVRRKKDNVKDLEIVCQPIKEVQKDMFGYPVGQQPLAGFTNTLRSFGEVLKGHSNGKYMQIKLHEGINLDIFMADKVNYGNIFLIRTGDWEFSKYFMGRILKLYGYCSEDGFVKKDKKVIFTPDEETIFKLVGIPFIKPEDRTLSNLKKVEYGKTIRKT